MCEGKVKSSIGMRRCVRRGKREEVRNTLWPLPIMIRNMCR